ncbi:MAG: hypothetical protein ACM3OC_08895 [Deltaproteobacteria bacterium]
MREILILALCLCIGAEMFLFQGCASMCGGDRTAKQWPAWDNSEAVADQNNTSSGLTAGATSNNGMLDIY